MYKGQVENYLRLHLLNVEEATTILRETLIKFLNKRSITLFLKTFKKEINKKKFHKDVEALIYPHADSADIDKWDVSLLGNVLDVCCTITYKAKKPLNEIFLKVTKNQKNDKSKIEKLLVDNKSKLEVKRDEGKLTEEEFDQVYSNPVNTKLDDYSLNFIILLLIICTAENSINDVIDGLRKILIKEIELLCNENPSLTTLVESKSTLFDEFTKAQIQTLTTSSGSLDLYALDIEALHGAVIALCETLSESTINAIQKIRHLRLSNTGHTANGQLDDKAFIQNWDELYHNILIITTENFPHKYKEIQKRIAAILCGNLDFKHSVQVIREGYFKLKIVTNNLDHIEHMLSLGTGGYRMDFNVLESKRWSRIMKLRRRWNKIIHVKALSGKHNLIKGIFKGYVNATELKHKEVYGSLIRSTRNIRIRKSTAVIETTHENDELEVLDDIEDMDIN